MSTSRHELGLLAAVAPEWDARLGGIGLRYGVGARNYLAGELRRLGIERPLLVTDPGVRATDRVDEAASALAAEGLAAAVFDAIVENPTTEHVDAGAAAAHEHGADGLVGFGGGSAMDAAKGINFIVSHGGRMEDYWGTGIAKGPMLASVGVPTTAGTGSDAQSYAVIARASDHRKMACGSVAARFRTVLLDPELLATAPPAVTAAAGLDAMVHAVESHVSTRANPISRLYSRAAWERIYTWLPRHMADPTDTAVAGQMLIGSHLAGAAIECSMLGAAHACANPLTARLDMTHGLAVGVLLPHVVAHNHDVAAEAYEELWPREAQPGETVAGVVAMAGIPARLRDHGVPREILSELAEDAATQWTAGFNPRPLDAAQLLHIYEQAY
jgi:alcohol dehydrogenase